MKRTALEIALQMKYSNGILCDEHATQLNDLISSIKYAAPEMEQYWIGRLSWFVSSIVPNPPTEDWHYRLIAALINSTENEVKLQVQRR